MGTIIYSVLEIFIFIYAIVKEVRVIDYYYAFIAIISWIEYVVYWIFVIPILFLYFIKVLSERGYIITLIFHWISEIALNAPYYYFDTDGVSHFGLWFSMLFMVTSTTVIKVIS